MQESTKGRGRTQSTGDLDELYQQAAEADVHLRAEHPVARIQRTSLGNDRLELRIEGGDEARAAEDLDKLGERELGADWKAMFGLRLVKPGPHAGRR